MQSNRIGLHKKFWFKPRSLFRASLFMLLLVFSLSSMILPALAQGPGGNVFLPLLSKGNGGGGGGGGGGNPPPTTPPPTNPPPTQPPPTDPVFTVQTFFVEPNTKTASAAVAVDPQGGKHLAYDYFVPAIENAPAVYLYCPPGKDCTDGANWSGVSFLAQVEEVQLALTPDGKPRLLFTTSSTHSHDGSGRDYYYAACDSNCTQPGSWDGTYILYSWGTAISDISNNETPQRYFALDHLGRPRFVYYDRNYYIEPDHWGSFYVWCDEDCTSGPEAWSETLIGQTTPYDSEIFEWPSLTFTKTGGPRIVANIFTLDDAQSGVYYVACDTNCDDATNWDRVRLFERGSMHYVAWDIAVDLAGRMHIAFYKGDTLDDTEFTLYYGICTSGCFNAANWTRFDMGFPTHAGEDVDLVIDRLGRPRMAYINDGDELEFAWCDSGCDLAQNWKREVIDTTSAITAEWIPPRPPTCDAAFWDTLIPSLALDQQGNAFVAYEARYNTRCWLEDPTDPTKEVYTWHELWHTVRGVFFPQP